MPECAVEFLADPERGGDGRFREAFQTDSWDEACSFLEWERDRDLGRLLRIARDGQVLGDPAGIKRLWEFGLEQQGFRPVLLGTLRGEQLQLGDQFRGYCRQAVCRVCVNVGAQYLSFYRLGRHRSFAVCPVCGDTTELQDD